MQHRSIGSSAEVIHSISGSRVCGAAECSPLAVFAGCQSGPGGIHGMRASEALSANERAERWGEHQVQFRRARLIIFSEHWLKACKKAEEEAAFADRNIRYIWLVCRFSLVPWLLRNKKTQKCLHSCCLAQFHRTKKNNEKKNNPIYPNVLF